MIIQTRKSKATIEFGDFQTPDNLARGICNFLRSEGIAPYAVVEPTCGKGNFLISSLETFDSGKKFLAVDINNDYLKELNKRIGSFSRVDIELKNADFFLVDWQRTFARLPQPLLIIGNPPWVTNSKLGSINSTNLPTKSNFQNHKGLDALTGKANFDISEWMLIHLLDCVQNQNAVLAMLCKTSVARKVLRYVWRNNFRLAQASMYIIDAKQYFNVSVDACLFVCKTGKIAGAKLCHVYKGLSKNTRTASISQHNRELLADIEKYKKWSCLDGIEHYKWRSGVKHDCAQVMEFSRQDGWLRNGLGQICDIEEDLLYPLFKGSDVAKNDVSKPKLWVLITQKNIGDDTEIIKDQSPKTWAYLEQHSSCLDKRKSSIYKKRARFSIFGIGKYTFCPWKVTICGFYKKIQFSVVGPYKGKPSMLDDTCYYIACKNKQESLGLAKLLNSEMAGEFLSSFIFWDSKRPITVDVLRHIDLVALANQLGMRKLPNCCSILPFK